MKTRLTELTIAHRRIVLAAGVACFAQALAQADTYHSVDFSMYHNATMQDRFAAFGAAPVGNVILGGVPFSIPTSGPNEWTRGEAFDHDGETTVLDIPVGTYGMPYVYTLINSVWGTPSGGHMQVEFFGSSGGYYSKDLIGNTDIRDWNLFFTNQINGYSTKNVFMNNPGRDGSPDVMDMQRFDLPSNFASQTLVSMRITDYRQVMVHSGILSGITVSDVPAPGSLALLALSALTARRRR